MAAGVRRIEAVCGDIALAQIQASQYLLDTVAAEIKSPVPEVAERVTQMLNHVKQLEKEVARLTSKLAAHQGDDLGQRGNEGIHGGQSSVLRSVRCVANTSTTA